MMRQVFRWMALSTALLLCFGLAGCGDDAGSGDGDTNGGTNLATGEGPCEEPDPCAGGVCVALIDGNNPPNYCTETCSAGTCPSGFYCDESTFALAGLSFCRFGDTEPMEPEPASEPPRLPCKEDADCEQGLVCATFQGERDCTIPCSTEDQCTPPTFGGITFDMATCGPDQTEGVTRDVCLPDLDCYPDPQASGCITGIPTFP